MNKFIVLIPQELDIKKSIENQPENLNAEYIKYIISFILSKLAFHIEHYDKETDELKTVLKKYIPINSKKDVLVRSNIHKTNIEFLISNNREITLRLSRTRFVKKVISILYRKGYVKDKVPYSYRLNPYFIGNRQKLVAHVISDYNLINNIKNYATAIPSIIKNGKFRFIGRYFNSDNLKIDVDRAILLCNSRYETHKQYEKYLNEMYQIIDLHNGLYRIYYKKDTDGRVHSNLTRLPKVYRKYVTYEYQQLVEVDLSNSILYFLSMILSNNVNDSILYKYSRLLMFYKSLKTVDISEIELIKQSSIDGTFYDSFVTQFEEYYSENDIKIYYENENKDKYKGDFKQKRKVVKKKILAMMFAKSENYQPVQIIFKTKFPQLLNVINEFKDANGHKTLSHVLLQLESHVMLDIVARKFNSIYYKNAPIFTLHDCLITTNDHSNQLIETMIDVFKKEFGVAPKMEISPWK